MNLPSRIVLGGALVVVGSRALERGFDLLTRPDVVRQAEDAARRGPRAVHPPGRQPDMTLALLLLALVALIYGVVSLIHGALLVGLVLIAVGLVLAGRFGGVRRL